MKKFLALFFALTLSLGFAACTKDPANGEESKKVEESGSADVEDVKSEGVMTHAEYIAAEKDAEVTIEAYVQATQSWWDNAITVYAQDHDGAYFLYNMTCSEEDSTKLIPGTKIKVTGYKANFEGEIEIVDATFEFVNDGKTFVAEAFDATALLGKDELIDHQNEFVSFKGMTLDKVEYKNGEPGDDIYLTVSKDGATYSFCIERYLTDPETEVYKAVADIAPGTVVDMEGFLYWYQGVNPHITSIKVAE